MRTPSSDPAAAPTVYVQIRGRLIAPSGHTDYPVVCKANLREIQFLHRQTGERVPIPWAEFLDLVANPHGMSAREFLEFLLAQDSIADSPPPKATRALPPGGPDATPRHP